ncbi:type II toxin-antitoxin system RelE/ParE family toxin [Salmonella enterica]
MTYEVIITPEAELQIINLHRYITEKASQTTANSYTDALLDYIDGFSTFPHRGNMRDDIRPGLRVTHFRHRTVIAFAVDGNQVFIAGVYHGGQSYEADFLSDAP